jgi:hypothetical protein
VDISVASSISKRLTTIEREIARLRETLGVSTAGEMLFHAPQNMWSEIDIVVEADGFGGAHILFVEGNYPGDYHTHKSMFFLSETEACKEAERLVS